MDHSVNIRMNLPALKQSVVDLTSQQILLLLNSPPFLQIETKITRCVFEEESERDCFLTLELKKSGTGCFNLRTSCFPQYCFDDGDRCDER